MTDGNPKLRGPFASQAQFDVFKQVTEDDAAEKGIPIHVEQVAGPNNEILARVERRDGQQAAALGVTGGAAAGAAAGAMVGGPVGAALGGAAGAALGAVMTRVRPTEQPAAAALPMSAQAEPRWLAAAREEIGQKEVDGSGSNPRIEEYFTWTSLGEKPDDVAWCGAFVSFCLGRAGVVEKGRGSARAADWLGWGDTLDKLRPGCVVVLEGQAPGASGHVGFWEQEEGGRIHLLAGNQSNRVNITPFRATELQRNGYRWPTRG